MPSDSTGGPPPWLPAPSQSPVPNPRLASQLWVPRTRLFSITTRALVQNPRALHTPLPGSQGHTYNCPLVTTQTSSGISKLTCPPNKQPPRPRVTTSLQMVPAHCPRQGPQTSLGSLHQTQAGSLAAPLLPRPCYHRPDESSILLTGLPASTLVAPKLVFTHKPV